MDLLLTHGYFLFEDPHELEVMRPYPPLGLLYISAHLKAAGFAVEVFDSTFADEAAFRQLIDRRRPPVVGFYANMMTRRRVVPMMAYCRDAALRVVVGGPDAANYPDNYLDHGADVVVIGEGERTMEALLPLLLSGDALDLEGVAGVVWRPAGGQTRHGPPRVNIEDLNAQPFPDRGAIDLARYVQTWREHHGQGAVSLITARGCPYKCTWCSHAVYGYSHRRRSVSNVADEVQEIVDRYQPDMLWYADDVFTIHHRWLRSYADELASRNLRLPFETISREDRLDEETIRTLAEMGCFRLWVGAESGSQRVLDAMQRRTDAERVVEVVHLLQKYGIEAGMFIMLGYEGEDEADLVETVDRLKAAGPDRFLTTVAYPIMNTPYYHQVADRVIPLKPWHEGSDRDQTVAGRRSARYYRYATRWMVSEVDYHRQRQAGTAHPARAAKTFLSARVGRLGMWLARGEVEAGPAR